MLSRLSAISLALLGATAAGQASAQWAAATPHWYLGGNVGRGSADFDPTFAVPPATVTGTSEDDRDTAWKLFGGYQLNRNIAIEGGYFDLGDYSYGYSSTLGNFAGTTKFRGLNLDLVGTFPLTERFSALARIGAIYTRATANTSSTGTVPVFGSRRENELGVKAGLGLEFAFSPALSVRGEYERYRVEDPVRGRGNIDVASVGLVYRFGGPVVAPTRVVAPPPPPPPPPPPRVVSPPPAPVQVMPPPPPPPPPAPAPAAPRPYRN